MDFIFCAPRATIRRTPHCTTQDNIAAIFHDNLYVVVHTASDYISLEKLQYEFITSFSLGNITDCVYIVNVDAIQGPLFVF